MHTLTLTHTHRNTLISTDMNRHTGTEHTEHHITFWPQPSTPLYHCLLRLHDLWRWKPEEPIRAHKTIQGPFYFFSASPYIQPSTHSAPSCYGKTFKTTSSIEYFVIYLNIVGLIFYFWPIVFRNNSLWVAIGYSPASLTTFWPSNTGRFEWCQWWLIVSVETIFGCN